MEEQSSENPKSKSKRILIAKIFSIVSFAFVFVLLGLAIVLDIVTFFDVVMSFIGAIFVSVATFIICILGFVASIILIFGVYLIDQYGFWPASATVSIFQQIMGDINITPERINAFAIGRVVLLILCCIVLLLSIASLVLKKSAKKDGFTGKTRLITAFDIVAIVFSSLGVATSIIMLLLVSII